MSKSYLLEQTLGNTLASAIDALVQTGPLLLNDLSLFQRLSELQTDLGSETVKVTALSPQPSHDEFLQMASATQQILAALSRRDNSGPNAEALSAIDEILTRLNLNLALTLRKEQAHRIRGLYVIIDPQVTGGREPLEVAVAAIHGGARMLQLRDKLRDKGESIPLAAKLQELCNANDVLLIINDHLDLAVAVDSGGVHVGQTDLPVADARRVLAPHQVLGRSNREIEQLVESQDMGADHLAFGPIYQTDTKSIVRQPQGVKRLEQAKAVAKVPLVAIGGINLDNLAPVVAAGANAICVTAAVGSAPDPEAATSRMVEAIQKAGGRV